LLCDDLLFCLSDSLAPTRPQNTCGFLSLHKLTIMDDDNTDQFDSEKSSTPPPNNDEGRKNRSSRVDYIGDGLAFGSSRTSERQPFQEENEDEEVGTTTPPPHLDGPGKDLAIKIDEKLADTRFWSKKLLQEMITYAKAMADVEDEYRRIHDLERTESDRLDQVEPEVEEAVSKLLNVPQH
jgi:hypothetical protein